MICAGNSVSIATFVSSAVIKKFTLSIAIEGEVLIPSGADMKETVEVANYMTQSTASMLPNDKVEGQLVSQLVVLYEQAMNWLGNAQRTERIYIYT